MIGALKALRRGSKLLRKGKKIKKRPMRNIKVKNYSRRKLGRGGKI
tara:strand:+ start:332 stop:469 length:138 start_codon:yes stop_codon:yes gene_type:complete